MTKGRSAGRSFTLTLLRARLSTLWSAVAGAAFVGIAVIGIAMAQSGRAEEGSYERTFRQPKSAIEKALKVLQPAMNGRLPVLDGFALTGDHPLNRYQRAYYQSAVQVSATALGESVVRVTTKVTAWYADSNPSHSGYQLLTSNGRLESDLLDQLGDLLAGKPNTVSSVERSREGSTESSSKNPSGSFPSLNSRVASASGASMAGKGAEEPAISAPIPQAQEKSQDKSPETGRVFSSPVGQGVAGQHLGDARTPPEAAAQNSLQAEAAALEEVLKNQAHPKNIVAIK
jgi:hypothetical protein